MATITRVYTPAPGNTILAAHLNTDLDAIYSEFNGSIEDANIAAAAAIAISKTALGTFTDWTADTPTWTGTGNPAIGNGAIGTRYCQIGNLVIAQFKLTAGGTTTYGTGNDWAWTLPVNSANNEDFIGISDTKDDDVNKRYVGLPIIGTATTFQIVNCGVTGALTTGTYGQTLPIATGWGAFDSIRATLIYEAA